LREDIATLSGATLRDKMPRQCAGPTRYGAIAAPSGAFRKARFPVIPTTRVLT